MRAVLACMVGMAVAAGSVMAVQHNASAATCGAENIDETMTAPLPSGPKVLEAAAAILGPDLASYAGEFTEMTAHPDIVGMAASISGSNLVIQVDLKDGVNCDPPANGVTTINYYAAKVVAFTAYLLTRMAVSAGLLMVPALEPFAYTAGDTTGVMVGSYLNTGLSDGKWGSEAVGKALFDGLLQLVGGTVFRLFFPAFDPAFTEMVTKLRASSSQWFPWVTQACGVAANAAAEVELTASASFSQWLADNPAPA